MKHNWRSFDIIRKFIFSSVSAFKTNYTLQLVIAVSLKMSIVRSFHSEAPLPHSEVPKHLIMCVSEHDLHAASFGYTYT